jgi:hypothetical protein
LRADYEATCLKSLELSAAVKKPPLRTRLAQSLLRLFAPLL